MGKSIIFKKRTSVSNAANVWLFCNVYSMEKGRQFGVTIQRAKNMQYTTKESH